MTSALPTTAFITTLLGEDRPEFDKMVSIVVYARNEDVDYVPLLAEFCLRGEVYLCSNSLYKFWSEIGEGEYWSYQGRDEDGEKCFDLMNEGSEQEVFNRLICLWREPKTNCNIIQVA